MITIAITIIGLILFEIVSSIDNAVINAEILKDLGAKARKWFLTWGLLLAVFLVRGILPFLIVWLANPEIGLWNVVQLSFTDPVRSHELIEQGAPLLLVGGGIFLVFLFLNWLFMEEKHFGLPHEKFFKSQSMWFYAITSLVLVVVLYFAENRQPHLSLAAALGSTVFFIIHGLNQKAEEAEEELLHSKKGKSSDWTKLALLMVIDAVFSIDGVVGAFAFTTSVPLILIGNGIGALVVRQITIGNIERIRSLKLLKNGAMYSIGILGAIMILDAFKIHAPEWLAPVCTVALVGYFYWRSVVLLKTEK
jgi:uncharacterized protein